MSLLQSPDVKNGEVRGEAGGKSEEGNGVASPPSSLFSPKFSTGRLASATVDHSSLSAGIREERRARNFVRKRTRVSQPGRHSYAPLAVKPVLHSDITKLTTAKFPLVSSKSMTAGLGSLIISSK